METRTAERKQSPQITVVEVTTDNLKELIENNILNETGTRVDPRGNKNSLEVRIGDFLRVDNMDEIYPINPEYFHANFKFVE